MLFFLFRKHVGWAREDLQESWQQKTLVWYFNTQTHSITSRAPVLFSPDKVSIPEAEFVAMHSGSLKSLPTQQNSAPATSWQAVMSAGNISHCSIVWCCKTVSKWEGSLCDIPFTVSPYLSPSPLTSSFSRVDTLLNNSNPIWLNCRLAVRQSAVITKKFASSIAPHITTILVHGKQVMFRQGRTIEPLHVDIS